MRIACQASVNANDPRDAGGGRRRRADLPRRHGRDGGHPGHSPASEDPKPGKKCPFGKGYATFLTAFSGGAGGGILDAPREAPLAANLDCAIAYVIALTPQSRGPPIEL